MQFNQCGFKPNTNRLLSQCGTMVVAGQDARWRGVKIMAHGPTVLNRSRVLDFQLRKERKVAIARRDAKA